MARRPHWFSCVFKEHFINGFFLSFLLRKAIKFDHTGHRKGDENKVFHTLANDANRYPTVAKF